MEQMETTQKKESWIKGLATEFKHIVWPKKSVVARDTGTVLVVAIVLGVAVAVFDFFLQYGMDLLMK